jgi:two-component system KDP operon response regulator KdpE
MAKPLILIVDDDIAMIKFISANLKAREYDVILASNGEDALLEVEQNIVDLIILDFMIPVIDGLEVCRRIREWSQVPIIMLSAKGDEEAKVKCLNTGADDYITKPFGIAELLARVQAAFRHHNSSKAAPLQTVTSLGELEVNFAKRCVSVKGDSVRLTPIEYSLLHQLMLNRNKVMTYNMLLQKVWGEHYYNEKEYVHVFIGRLRNKIERDPKNPKYIVTVPGVGYYINSG